jgi:uncharacterized membrane protein
MEEGKRIAWNSKEGSEVKTSGQVVFTQLPHDETQVTVTLQVAPQGALAGAAAGLFSKLEETLEDDLRSFKAYAEARQPASTPRG